MPLAELQRRMRQAVVEGRDAGLTPRLVGGSDPDGRLAVHQRHYHGSLVSAILSRHPATAWLVGSDPIVDAARTFVRQHPPSAPCLAEYGAAFGGWLACGPASARAPFLAEFAELDWQLGRVAVEIAHPPLASEAVASLAPELLCDVRLQLQPGLHYLRSSWPIDEVMRLFLTGEAPNDEPLRPAEVRLEVRGAGGAFQIQRLDAGTFTFRAAVQLGETLGSASALALAADAGFAPGDALVRLLAGGLAVDLVTDRAGAARD